LCQNAQAVLDAKQVSIKSIIDARKEKINADNAWELLKTSKSITTAKGKKVLGFSPDSNNKSEILKHAMGPTGNLRAPALCFDDQFVIGFNKELYEQVF
jgi:arsenate reductase-like glutaredoxin family protein